MSDDGLGFGYLRGVGRALGCGIMGWRRGRNADGWVNGAGLRSIRDMAYRLGFCIRARAGSISHLQAGENWGTALIGRHSPP